MCRELGTVPAFNKKSESATPIGVACNISGLTLEVYLVKILKSLGESSTKSLFDSRPVTRAEAVLPGLKVFPAYSNPLTKLSPLTDPSIRTPPPMNSTTRVAVSIAPS